MSHRSIDIVDEFVFLRRENERLKKRLDKIELPFVQASALIDDVKREVESVKKTVETVEMEMKNGKCV